MTKKPGPEAATSLLRHPFIIVLAVIVIAYAGYLFGVKLYALTH